MVDRNASLSVAISPTCENQCTAISNVSGMTLMYVVLSFEFAEMEFLLAASPKLG